MYRRMSQVRQGMLSVPGRARPKLGGSRSPPVNTPSESSSLGSVKSVDRSGKIPRRTNSRDLMYTPDSSEMTGKELYVNLAKLVVSNGDSDLVGKYVDRAIAFAQTNELGGKEFVQILYLLSKIVLHANSEKYLIFLQEFSKKLNRNKFLANLLPLDIAVGLNSLTRLRKISARLEAECRVIVKKLAEEVPVKVGHFEDHHLAQVLHALSAFGVKDSVVLDEVVVELMTSRDLISFNPQTVVIICTSLARLDQPSSNDMHAAVWVALMKRAATIPRKEMQPNWPDVLLTSAAMSQAGTTVPAVFLEAMTQEVVSQFKAKQIGASRVAKALHALVQLQAPAHLIRKLRPLCE